MEALGRQHLAMGGEPEEEEKVDEGPDGGVDDEVHVIALHPDRRLLLPDEAM
jgi:hypothetical protein